MKLFTAQLATETNTFAPCPTGWGGFEESGIFHGDASLRAPQGMGFALAEVRRLAERDGHEIVESICAEAQPSGPTIRAVYESLRDEILGKIEAAQPLGGVLLVLHGAMVAEDTTTVRVICYLGCEPLSAPKCRLPPHSIRTAISRSACGARQTS